MRAVAGVQACGCVEQNLEVMDASLANTDEIDTSGKVDVGLQSLLQPSEFLTSLPMWYLKRIGWKGAGWLTLVVEAHSLLVVEVHIRSCPGCRPASEKLFEGHY